MCLPHAKVAQEQLQFTGEAASVFGRVYDRLGDQLHQWHARAIKIY